MAVASRCIVVFKSNARALCDSYHSALLAAACELFLPFGLIGVAVAVLAIHVTLLTPAAWGQARRRPHSAKLFQP